MDRLTRMKVAYLVNQYPKVSHTFIKREILALERQGFDVLRVALRGWDGEVVDPDDLQERQRTRYVLKDGTASLVWAVLRMCAQRPAAFLRALTLALRMARRADRSLPYHLIYLAEACRILPWLAQHGAQHLHAHFGTNPAEVALLVHALGGPPYSFTVHGPEEYDKPEFIGLTRKIEHAAFVVAITAFGRGQLLRWAAPADWKKIEVVHCGVDTAFHLVPPVPIPAAPRLVCVGRLCREKGQLLLIRAVADLVRRGVAIELTLCGDGEMRPQLEALIAELGLGAHVRITGWLSGSQVRTEILHARALVLASFAEGLPVVIMEAMALRRPVVSTWIAGIPELVIDGENGWLIPSGDVDALSAALEACLAMPSAHLERLGNAGHARVMQRHDADTEAGRLGGFFTRRATTSLENEHDT